MHPSTTHPLSRLLLLVAITLGWSASRANAQEPWSLTDDARRAFLHYYSPVILKRADEDGNPNLLGHDWITNFNFDRDGNFSDNDKRWRRDKRDFIAGTDHADWRIQPTLYTALIEFTQGGEKSLILLYHVYHALQGGIGKDVHDWERIEVRIDGARPGGPGSGEVLNYFVLTAHSLHAGRALGHHDLHFLDARKTSGAVRGKHLLVWQAEWNGTGLLISSPPNKSELRFVEDNVGEFVDAKALVDVSGTGNEFAFHYVFVDRDAEDATAYWHARELTRETARDLASGRDEHDVIQTDATIRITYELQDLGDVFPTHSIDAYWPARNKSWSGTKVMVDMTDGIRSDLTGTPISLEPGLHEFYGTARGGKRRGYPRKHWFWGTYLWNCRGSWTEFALVKRDGVWNQHDYFAHDGVRGARSGDTRERAGKERGRWLPPGWHLPENGGFDGRWVSLFED
ncbi:MAG: hypothetical protein E2O39_16005 [Planctomycetota bacterium]|nr:MAG: hypothetical protein E2O39_16005 [Planctomycetota bacterium]